MKAAMKDLKEGLVVTGRPTGNSMSGRIDSGDEVTIEPIGEHEIRRGSIVLCKVRGKIYLHLVKKIKDGKYLIANNHGRENGWTSKIYGIVTKVEP